MNIIYRITNDIATIVGEEMSLDRPESILDKSTVRKEKYEQKYSEYDYDTVVEHVNKARFRCTSARENCISIFILMPIITIIFMLIYAILFFILDTEFINILEYLGIVITTEVIAFLIPSLIENISDLDDAHIELEIGEKILARWDEYNRLTKEK